MIRKAVLLGSREGPWSSIHDFINPRLQVQGDEGLEVELSEGYGGKKILPLGEHRINQSEFIRVCVVSGDHESAICTVLSGAA